MFSNTHVLLFINKSLTILVPCSSDAVLNSSWRGCIPHDGMSGSTGLVGVFFVAGAEPERVELSRAASHHSWDDRRERWYCEGFV